MFFRRRITHQSSQGVLHASLMVPREGIYQLDKEFSYYIWFDDRSFRIDLPVGYITNFASVPKWAWRFFHPVENQLLVASCLHDFLVNEFKAMQPELTRMVQIDKHWRNADEEIDAYLAADLFFAVLKQERSYSWVTRQFLRGCVKGFYFCTLKGWI